MTRGVSSGRADIRARLAGLDVDAARIDDIVEELGQHLDDRYAELLAAGEPPHQARRLVLDELAARTCCGARLDGSSSSSRSRSRC